MPRENQVMSHTFASLFSGGGLADVGAVAAGLLPIWGVEANPAIAEIFESNHDCPLICARVEATTPQCMDAPDVLWASPPCTSYSVANTNGKESPGDLAAAKGVCAYLRALRPRAFVMENVLQYRSGRAYSRIMNVLNDLGYFTDANSVLAADYGVPQTRRRLIVRALRDNLLPPLPAPVPWVGWFAAIEDLIPSLPESKFANWQLERLPKQLATILMQVAGETSDYREQAPPAPTITANHGARKYRAFLIDGRITRTSTDEPPTVRSHYSPAFTVTGSEGAMRHRAFLIDGQNGSQPHLTVRASHEPALTITNANKGVPRALMQQGRVVSMTPRALARFQSIPDTYLLPTYNVLACKIVGNAVPPLLAQRILEGLLDAIC